MGNLKAQYKKKRGSNEAGADITDAKDFFKEFIDSETTIFDEHKALYD